jgi:hypothetical protein
LKVPPAEKLAKLEYFPVYVSPQNINFEKRITLFPFAVVFLMKYYNRHQLLTTTTSIKQSSSDK